MTGRSSLSCFLSSPFQALGTLGQPTNVVLGTPKAAYRLPALLLTQPASLPAYSAPPITPPRSMTFLFLFHMTDVASSAGTSHFATLVRHAAHT